VAHDAWRARRLAAERLPGWLINFSFHVPVPWGRVEINAHQRIVEHDEDPATPWDDGLREALAYTSHILHDRTGRVRRLIEARTRLSADEQIRRLARLASRLDWDIRRIPERMAGRGDFTAGHHVLNAAVDELVEVAYLLAGRFLPSRKWRLDGLHRYGLLSAAEVDTIAAAVRVADLGRRELDRRMTLMDSLWADVRPRLPAEISGTDVYAVYSARYSVNRQLKRRTVADAVLDRFGDRLGTDVFDLVNFLAVDSPGQLADLDAGTVESLPMQWRDLAVRLRDVYAQSEGARQ
jgi:hypothetical protein